MNYELSFKLLSNLVDRSNNHSSYSNPAVYGVIALRLTQWINSRDFVSTHNEYYNELIEAVNHEDVRNKEYFLQRIAEIKASFTE